MKMNCWEFKGCGREEGGFKAAELGICPVFEFTDYDGVHDGSRGGRSCWAIPASLCEGQKQGIYVQKFEYCRRCDFFKAVKKEEEQGRHGFAVTPSGIRLYLKSRFNTKAGSNNDDHKNGKRIEAPHIAEIEKRFIFLVGYDGRRMIDSVFVDLQYRRGTDMTEGQFHQFVNYLLHCFSEDRKNEFLKSVPYINIFLRMMNKDKIQDLTRKAGLSKQ